MSLTYNTWLSAVVNLLGTTATNPAFVIEVPNAIDYAEQRIFRDLDLISTITTDTSQATVVNNRNVAVPSAFVVLNGANIITPFGTSNPELGKRNPLVKVSTDFLDFMWPDVTSAGVPRLFALLNQSTIRLGPWPSNVFTVEFVGTQRPAPLSSSNQSTFLSTNLPDLFEVATMIHLVGYQMNFGAQADDPRAAVSWEMQYTKLIGNADAEELRKRYAGTSMMPPQGMAKQPAAAPGG